MKRLSIIKTLLLAGFAFTLLTGSEFRSCISAEKEGTAASLLTTAPPPPTADPPPVVLASVAGFRPAQVINTLRVVFTDESLNATVWRYLFGEGSSTSTERNPQHTYLVAGTYDVRQTACPTSDFNDPLCDSLTLAVTVIPIPAG